MKTKYSDLPVGACFHRGKRGAVRKKLQDGKAVSVSNKGRVRTQAVKGDPNVNMVSCPLKFLGAGLRKVPGVVIEIGNTRRRRK